MGEKRQNNLDKLMKTAKEYTYKVLLYICKRYFSEKIKFDFPSETKPFYPLKEICFCGGVSERQQGDNFYKYRYVCKKCGKELYGGGYNLYLLELNEENSILYESHSNDKGENFRTEIKLGTPIIKKTKS